MRQLKRNLGVFGAIAISLAAMGPTMSVSLNPQAIAQQVNSAVPTAFMLAVIPLGLIVGSFVLLTKRSDSAGSVFGLVRAEIGPRSGTAAGVWLVAAYIACVAITALSFGIFVATLLPGLGWLSSSQWLPILLALIVLPITTYLAGRTMRALGHALLILEGLTMTTILVVAVITLTKLITTGGPQGQYVEWSAFRLDGVTAGALALALTFALLSSAGFEGAAAVGEETRNPRKAIPLALIWTIVLTSAFFIFVTTIAVWAFGTAPNQMQKFVASGSLPGDIANLYVSAGIGDFITLGGAISSFACMIALQVAGGRIIYALARDGIIPSRLQVLSPRDTPVVASLVVGAIAMILVIFAVLVTGAQAFSAFELTSDLAGVVFIGAYVAACAAAAIVLWRQERGRAWALLPVTGILVLIIILALQVFPLATGWELIAPLLGLAVLLGGGIFGFLRGHRANA
ncbi:MAG: APC family permease [Actinobacteria bacterium]|nr:APC family permease [Actinomycetota bacterium]